MRIQCPQCLKWVKDKMFIGFTHVCATPEEVANAYKTSQWYRQEREKALKELPRYLKNLSTGR